MKKLLLIALLIVGCDNSTAPEGCVDYEIEYESLCYSNIIGEWLNVDNDTPHITKVEISMDVETGLLYFHMWGSCGPTDCDWGIETANILDLYDNQVLIIWNQSHAIITNNIFYQTDNQLRVEDDTHYIDYSGRPDSQYTSYFERTTLIQ